MYIRTEMKSMSLSVYGIKLWNSLKTIIERVEIYMFSKHVIRILVLLVILLTDYNYFVLEYEMLYWRCYIYICICFIAYNIGTVMVTSK